MISATSVPWDIAVDMLVEGAKMTIVLSVFSILLGLVIGLPVALTETYGNRTLIYVFWLMLVLGTTSTCYSMPTPESPNNPATI